MFRLRTLSWLVVCGVLFSTVAPALPAQAASSIAVTSPISQDDVADRIAEIRNEAPDLEDDFEEAGSLFSTDYEGTTSTYLKSGELHIAVDEESTLAWSKLDQEVADFYMEVDTIHSEGSLDNQYGILARFDDDGNYYLFAASSDGYYTIQVYLDGEWEPIVEWTESDTIAIGEGELNTLGLLAEGDTYTFLINDSIVDSVTDDTLDGTELAFNAAAFDEPPMEMSFDNFRLWYVGDPIEEASRQAPVDARNIDGTPEPTVTEEATVEVTEEPTDEPTVAPTDEPTVETTPEPTEEPTEEPTVEVTSEPTAEPTEEPTAEPPLGTSSDPTIAAIQGQPAAFSDDFEDADTSDWISFPSDTVVYEVFEGAYEFVFSAPNVLAWSESPLSPDNFYIEVDATINSPLEGAEYGIIFNYFDSQNFYLYAVNNASRYSVWRLVNNTWEVVYDWTDSTALLSGEGNTNRLGLLVQDTTAILVANDEVLAEIDTGQEAGGGVALAAGTFDEADLIMSFDNVLLWDLDATGEATPEPTTEVEPTGEPTEEPTEEPTSEPTDEPVSEDFSEIEARIEEIKATESDLVDDFRRDSGTWDTQSHDFGGYFYEGRMFNIEAYAEERIVWSAYYEDEVVEDPVQFDNFYVEFDTTFVILTGENATGLVFRLVDTDNFYKFMVDEVGYFQLQKRVDGEYSDVIEWTMTDAINAEEEAVNRIGILADGSTIAFTLNGEVIGTAEDEDLTVGGIALAIQTYSSDEGHSSFDNLELWEIDE